MERGSDKHGPRLDEDLKRDTRGGEEARVPDSDDDGEAPRATRDEVPAPVGDLVYEPDLDERSELTRFLEPSVFPAGREQILASAEGNFAPERIVERLRELPEGERFANVQAMWRALGGPTEQRA